MSEISERYRRLSAAFTERVVAVPEDRWDSPSPCEEWTARDVVGHMRDGSGTFFANIGRELPPGPSIAEDPVGTWTTVREAMQGALDDPDVAGTEYESPLMGRQRFDVGVDQFVNFDVLVHTWDLARAAGLDERLDEAEVHRTFERILPADEMLRSPRVCGPKLDPPPGADEQTRFLAFLGRRA
ncbi:MAG TPA: TIGR03086 family metal-binding protein [Candidatus Dormibacteraeota bacterium]|jgi:uncharacterized protein (TIGR03086 family)|nr:TIGR03086 family metal-binding protein [Candidatus Dormibacteraeota bacterium]